MTPEFLVCFMSIIAVIQIVILVATIWLYLATVKNLFKVVKLIEKDLPKI
jgi:hypothetical protein